MQHKFLSEKIQTIKSAEKVIKKLCQRLCYHHQKAGLQNVNKNDLEKKSRFDAKNFFFIKKSTNIFFLMKNKFCLQNKFCHTHV